MRIVLYPLPVPHTSFESGDKISKKLGRESNLKNNVYGKPQGRRQRKCKSHREICYFHFHFLTISYDGN